MTTVKVMVVDDRVNPAIVGLLMSKIKSATSMEVTLHDDYSELTGDCVPVLVSYTKNSVEKFILGRAVRENVAYVCVDHHPVYYWGSTWFTFTILGVVKKIMEIAGVEKANSV